MERRNTKRGKKGIKEHPKTQRRTRQRARETSLLRPKARGTLTLAGFSVLKNARSCPKLSSSGGVPPCRSTGLTLRAETERARLAERCDAILDLFLAVLGGESSEGTDQERAEKGKTRDAPPSNEQRTGGQEKGWTRLSWLSG